MTARWSAAVAASVYLALALVDLAPVLRAPHRLLPYPALLDERGGRFLDHADQAFVVHAIARNARALAARPWEIHDAAGQCHPLARAHTLGEHAFGEGLLAAIPLALTGSPILAYNAVVVLSLWIPGLAMYALAYHFTGSAWAAFFSGLVFAFQPARLVDPTHPFVHGDLWTPLVLLFLHRLCAANRWRDAAGLVVSTGLALLESFYQVIAMSLLVAVDGGFLLVRRRGALRALAPKLVVAAAAITACAAALFGPYLATRDTWSTLQGRVAVALVPAEFFQPGGRAFLGFVVLALAGLGLADRIRGPRSVVGEDPRIPLAAAGAFVLWCVVWELHVPFLGPIASPLLLARETIPGLDAIRALPIIRMAVNLVAAFLAGYGVLAAIERRTPAMRAALAGILSIAFAGEIAIPAASRASFRGPLHLRAREARPPTPVVALLDRLPAGAVLDVPMATDRWGRLTALPHFLLHAAYHARPVAACYNSFSTPLGEEIERRASALTADDLDELYALGFRSLVVHDELLDGAARDRLDRALAPSGRLRAIGEAERHRAYALESRLPVREGFEPLAGDATLP